MSPVELMRPIKSKSMNLSPITPAKSDSELMSPIESESMHVSPITEDSDVELQSAIDDWVADNSAMSPVTPDVAANEVISPVTPDSHNEAITAIVDFAKSNPLTVEAIADFAKSNPLTMELCTSCGFRPAVHWLGYDECPECFDAHTDC